MLTVEEAKIRAALADLDPGREDFLMLLAGVTPRRMADLGKVHVNTVTGRLRPYVQAIPGLMELHRSQIPARPGTSSYLQEKWRARHQEFAEFHAEHGQLPTTVSSRPGERTLAVWLRRQRKAKREGRLDEEQLRLMDQVPGWFEGRHRSALRTRHDEYLARLEAFHEAHDCWPRFRAEDPEERAVGIWLHHRRSAARAGALDAALAEELSARAPGWRGRVNRPRRTTDLSDQPRGK